MGRIEEHKILERSRRDKSKWIGKSRINEGDKCLCFVIFVSIRSLIIAKIRRLD